MGRTLLATLLFTALAAAEPPRALVVEHADKRTKAVGLAAQLEKTGYTVRPLALDRAPEPGMAEIVAIGSFATERPEVAAYLREHAAALQAFVRAGGVVLQMTQADQTERRPAFLPEGMDATRTDRDDSRIYVTARGHPLLRGLDGDEILSIPPLGSRRPSSETFGTWRGLRVLLAHDRGPAEPVLLEGALGKGRVVLTSLFLDKVRGADGTADWRVASDVFFRTVRAYVQMVEDGRAPPVAPTPPHDPHAGVERAVLSPPPSRRTDRTCCRS